jgi:hypothetical protein
MLIAAALGFTQVLGFPVAHAPEAFYACFAGFLWTIGFAFFQRPKRGRSKE